MGTSTGRRRFLQLGGALTGAMSLPASAMAAARSSLSRSPYATPTFLALIDTVVPGQASDPTGAPGALEAGTLEYIDAFDRAKLLPIPMRLVQIAVSQALTGMSVMRHFKPFYALDLRQRTRIVSAASKVPGFSLLLSLIRAPFYTGSVNRVGFDYLGYPGGPTEGYGDFSFKEVTWSPHPRGIDGNLP